MKNLLAVLIIGLGIFIGSCQHQKEKPAVLNNPPAEGFNTTDSDPEAIALADSVMLAMGGRTAWDQTRYLKWNFFNARRLIWDKWDQKVVIEGIRDTFNIQMDLENMTGKVNWQGVDITTTDSVGKYLERGKSIWINDSYWLVMPFKLKDSGVTLKYLGRDTTENGLSSEVLQLTFNEVGDTPQNMYKVHIDPSTFLVSQWDFYTNATDSLPRFKTPWTDYQSYGSILLSGDRGNGRLLTEIETGSALADYFN